MQFRHGICSSCKAEYKIPASFAADRARCNKCGGAVEIGSVQDGDAPAQKPAPAAALPPPVPAAVPPPKPVVTPQAKPAAPPPAPIATPRPFVAPTPAVPPRAPVAPQARPAPPQLEEVTPSGKQRSGPSMKEKLLARRAAEAAAAEPVHRIEAAPPARHASGDVGPVGSFGANLAPPVRRSAISHPAPAGKSAAPVLPVAPVVPLSKGAAGAPVAKTGARASGSSKKRPARGGRGRGAKAGDDKQKPKGKGPMLLVGSVLGLIVIGAGAYFFLFAGDEPVQAKDGAAIDATIEDATTGAENAAPAAAPSKAADDAQQDPGDASDDASDLKDAGDAPADGADAAAAPAKPAGADVVRDPSEIDLAAIPEFGPAGGTTDERWTELQEMVQTATFNTAAPGNRARIALEEAGKEAFPAILNVMKTLDYSTTDGYRNGDLLQRTLMKIVSGKNFGWKYTTEPNDVWFNKKAVQMWSTQWDRAKDDEAYWLNFSQKDAKPGEAKDEAPIDEKTEEALDDLDDL